SNHAHRANGLADQLDRTWLTSQDLPADRTPACGASLHITPGHLASLPEGAQPSIGRIDRQPAAPGGHGLAAAASDRTVLQPGYSFHPSQPAWEPSRDHLAQLPTVLQAM